jgi:tetratricopeptide (TPR) repeat protein
MRFTSNTFICGLLLIGTIAAYGKAADCGFVNFDDDTYVLNNPQVRTGLTPQSLWWAFTATQSANWHPITWMSLQLDAALYGKQAAGYHLTSVIFHAANTVFLFLVLRLMTQAPVRSALVAALFGLHPLHVESVVWIFERKDVISAFFWILTMGTYARFVEQPRLARYMLVIGVFALGLMSKPMLVTLPCVLLLLDYWPLGIMRSEKLPNLSPPSPLPKGARGEKSSRGAKKLNNASADRKTETPPVTWSASKVVWQKLPLFALSAASSILTLTTQRDAMRATEEYPLFSRIGNAAVVYVDYIGMTFWPAHLSVFYPYIHDQSLLRQAASALLLVGITLFVLLHRSRPYLLVGWLWYLGTLVPVIGIVQVGLQGMADRYTYIPSIGLFIALVWGLADVCAAIRVPQWAKLGFAGAVLLACLLLTRSQVEHWHNSWTLWQHALRANPDNYLAHESIGSLYYEQGNYEQANRHFRLALASNPNDAKAWGHLEEVLHKQGRTGEAIQVWREALQVKPTEAEWHHNLGQDLLQAGQPDEAIEHFREAIRLKPELAFSHFLLGRELAKRGQKEEASEHLEEAFRLMPELRNAPRE